MKRRRFFINPGEIDARRILLSREESHHLRDVLRLGVGDEIELMDGKGGIIRARVAEVANQVTVEMIASRTAMGCESELQLVVALALIRPERFEWAVQKCTELGVHEFIPLVTRYSEEHRRIGTAKRQERWSRIAREAAKQCGRVVVPVVQPPQSLADVCRGLVPDSQSGNGEGGANGPQRAGLAWVLSERGSSPWGRLADLQTPPHFVALVGPEGGWSEEETYLFEECGIPAVRVGPRTLRSETAAVVAAALAQYLWGDLGSFKFGEREVGEPSPPLSSRRKS